MQLNFYYVKLDFDIGLYSTKRKGVIMKVAILTICDYFNHGSRLQNFALQEAIRGLGYEVETINISPKRFYSFVNPLCTFFYPRMRKSYRWGKSAINGKMHNLNFKKLQEIGKKFDYVVVGSDQMFNPVYISNSDITFLRFVEKEKRVAYAPSFGISELPDKYLSDFKDGLLGIDKLSVREADGGALAQKICGKAPEVVLDPTLLLTKKQWQDMAQPVKIKHKYILTYNMGVGDHQKKRIKQVAKQNNLKVISLNHFLCKFHNVTPAQFIYLIDHAELVCTNSFHGHALSIIMEKPFISLVGFSRTKSRIQNMLELLGITGRNWKEIADEDIFKMDYSQINKNLQTEREKSMQFLKNALRERK